MINTKDSAFEATELQKLKNIEDKILCRALRCLKGTQSIVKSLSDINRNLPATDVEFAGVSNGIQQQLQLMSQRLESHIVAAELLGQRVTATLGLVIVATLIFTTLLILYKLTNMLDLQNQANSDRISTRMLRLTRESVDDNVTVRVITVCTLIYLPASFMATFFGMNFFEFRSDIDSLRISPNFWIYVAATIPLTLVTVGAWYLFKLRHDRRRRKQHDEEDSLGEK